MNILRQMLHAAENRAQFEQQIVLRQQYNMQWIRDSNIKDLSMLSEEALQYHSDFTRSIRIAFNEIDRRKNPHIK